MSVGASSLGRSDEAAVFTSRRLRPSAWKGCRGRMRFARANEELDKIAPGRRGGAPALTSSDADGMATTAVAVSVHREGNGWAGEAAWVGDSTVWHLDADSAVDTPHRPGRG